MASWTFARSGIMTPRERQVLEMACDGMTDAEIAQALAINNLTVKHHMRNIYEKLGVNRRPRVIIAAVQAGLVMPKWLQEAIARAPSRVAA